jgi:hypothetical protein
VIESAPPPVVQQAPPEPQPQPVVSARPAGVEPAAAQPQVQQTAAATVQPSAQQPAVVAQSQPHPSNGQAASNPNSVPSDRGQPIKTSLDPALNAKPPLKDPCTVTVHLVESTHNTLPSGKSPSVFVYKKQVTERDIKKVKPLFSLANKAKAGPFKWGEAFSIYIKDAEMDVICLRFNFKDAKSDSGFIGEIEFPLRGAVRKFDKPNGIFQWWPLKKGNDSIGQALIFIEYCDPRPFSGPSDVQHKGHVGITSGGGFEIRDIPQEWKQLFRVLNIKKKDLENNAEMAQEVLGIMQQAVKDGVWTGSAGAEPINNNDYDRIIITLLSVPLLRPLSLLLRSLIKRRKQHPLLLLFNLVVVDLNHLPLLLWLLVVVLSLLHPLLPIKKLLLQNLEAVVEVKCLF